MILLLAFAAWLSGNPARAAEWLRLTSPGFELYTDAGEKLGRVTLERLEQIRQAFRDIDGDHRESPLPVRVFLFAEAAEFRIYQPSKTVKGFYQGGAERNYIVVLAGEDSLRVAFHEYIHLVLNHTSVPLPKWFEEGLAEFYSTLEPARDKLIIGRPVAVHVRTLTESPWIDADSFANVMRGSVIYDESEKVGMFYAQSWALVHMLNLAPAYRERLPEYAGLLADGAPAAEAFTKAFGKPLHKAIDDLRSYARTGRWPQVEVAWEAPEAVSIAVHSLDDSEALLARAGLQLQLGRWDVSEEALEKLASRAGSTVDIETARSMVAMSRRDFAASKKHLDKAIQLGSRKASTFFEYAMLLRETGAPPTQVADYLRKTVELNPKFAEAHFLLGVMASAEGQPEQAVESLRRATAILPRQASFWHALALAYHETGERELARHAAARALQAAVTKQEIEMATAAMRLDGVPVQPRRATRPAVTTPASWRNRQGDSRVEGTLEKIECLGQSARLYIRSSERTIALDVTHPGEVSLKNASSQTFEFSCGKQEARKVIVEYAAKPGLTGASGEVTSIEFQ